MDVRGKAILKDGRKIVLELEPGVAPQPSTTPPHPDALVQEIADGKLLVHPSKAQITVRRIQMQICNIQRGLRLLIGAEGQWSNEADERLKSWFLRAERKKNRTDTPSPSPSALEDASSSGRLALEDPSSSTPLALENVKPENSSVENHATNALDDDNPTAIICEDSYVDNHGANVLDDDKPAVESPTGEVEADVLDDAKPAVESPTGEVEAAEDHHSSNGADSSDASSTSSSSSSATRLRATIQRSVSALQEIHDIVSDSCPDCADALLQIQDSLAQDGVTRYYSDATQGPACAISCPAATVYRNYFVNGSGQAKGRQLDGLADIAELVGNAKEKYWRMVNGYCLPTDNKSMGRLAQRLKEDEKLSEALRDRLRIGVHWDTEVANKDHRVCQVFCSALPVAYAKSTRSQDWEAFGRLVLQGTFEATLAIAAVLSIQRQCRTKVYLSAVGGGAFGNRTAWIVDAIERALRIHAESPLDVMLVHFSSVPRGAYGDLEKGRKKLKATAPKPEATAPPEPPAEVGDAPEAGSDAVILAKAFKRLDLNGDGVILEEEMAAVLKKIMP
ncbi:unnamed protein product, partial [Cladocopium goreaui]